MNDSSSKLAQNKKVHCVIKNQPISINTQVKIYRYSTSKTDRDIAQRREALQSRNNNMHREFANMNKGLFFSTREEKSFDEIMS